MCRPSTGDFPESNSSLRGRSRAGARRHRCRKGRRLRSICQHVPLSCPKSPLTIETHTRTPTVTEHQPVTSSRDGVAAGTLSMIVARNLARQLTVFQRRLHHRAAIHLTYCRAEYLLPHGRSFWDGRKRLGPLAFEFRRGYNHVPTCPIHIDTN